MTHHDIKAGFGAMFFLLMLCLLMAASSCKTTKHISKEVSHKDSTGQTKTEFTRETTTTERAIDSLLIGGTVLIGDFDTEDTTEQVIESEDQKITVKNDKRTGKSHIKAETKTKKVAVPIERKTVTKESAKSETKVTVKTDTVKKQKDVEKTGFFIKWYWWVLIVIAAVLVLYKIFKSRIANRLKMF